MENSAGGKDFDREQVLLDALEETIDLERVPPSDETTTGRIGRARASLEGKRGSSRLIDAGFSALERNRRVSSTLLAGALASRLVVYAIPFLVLAVVATGFYSDVTTVNPIEAARDAGIAGLLAEAVEETTSVQDGIRVATLVGMLFATVWAADSLARLVRRIHALIWGVRMRRPKFRWALPLVVIAVSVGAMLVSRLGLEVDEWPTTVVISEILIELFAVTLIWILVTRFLPVEPDANTWRGQLPGALLVGIGTVGMKAATVFYLAPRAVALTDRYGDVTSAVIFITWAYWMAFVVVFSAELNTALFRSRPPPRTDTQPGSR